MLEILRHFRSYGRSWGPWLRPWVGLGLLLVGFAVGAAFIAAGCIPYYTPKPGEVVVQWWNILTVVGCSVGFWAGWWCVTRIYLYSGRGIKIGVAL